MWNRYGKPLSVILCALLVSSALIVFLPTATANIWKEETDTDFQNSEATFWNTEVVGTGNPASVKLKKNFPNWVNMEPGTSPEARESPASCYAPSIGKMIIFGGYSSGTYYNDTWEYDFSTNSWTNVSPASSPPGREWSAMAYASYWGVCVLFGGYGGSFLSDTWEYDVVNQTWQQTTPPLGPSAMGWLSLAYYKSVYRVILFGQTYPGSTMETWAYNPDTNVWLQRSPSAQPSTRSGYAMAYHDGIDRVVLFGGSYQLTFYNDTWEYDYIADSWSPKSTSAPPQARVYHSMTYRSSDDFVILFGGVSGATYLDDTWTYTHNPNPNWTKLNPVFKPGARDYGALEYDSVNDYVLLFGGWDGNVRLNDTWALGMGYQFQGAYTSRIFYCGEGDVDWGQIWWNQTPAQYPQSASLQIRLASSPIKNPSFWNYVGPDGSGSTNYSFPGQEIWSGHDNRTYMRYQVTFLSNDGKYSAALDNITITFNPIAVNPKIVETHPKNIEFNVPAYADIIVNFSKPMKTSSVSWTITPYVLATPSWSGDNMSLTLTHSDPFTKCNHTTVLINGTDENGLPLVPNPNAPNPWTFFVECTKPKITSTDPSNGQTGVALNKDVIIDFSEEMDPTSLAFTVSPDPGGWSQSWSNGNTKVTLSHTNPFKEWWRIDFDVTKAKSIFGQDLIPGTAPNPWWFETTGYSPYIVSTDPADNETQVALDKAVVIVFSEAMNTSTVTVDISPSIVVTKNWVGNTQLTLTHAANFLPCQAYLITVDGKGQDGNNLVQRYGYPPNPFRFMTTCTYPYITETRPYDGETGVAVTKYPQVFFSETMNPASLQWTISPNPYPEDWVLYWPDPEMKIVQFNHSMPFTYCTQYTMEITHAEDLDGNNIVPGPAPNPWTFTTFSDYPCILNTNPADSQTNVSYGANIWVNFSETIDTTTFDWSISPKEGLGWSQLWSNQNKTVRLSHSKEFTPNQQYWVTIITARDVDGNDLVQGPVPNPWWFRTTFNASYPYITYHYPPDGGQDVPVDANVIVNFSEPMDTATVTWNFIRLSTGLPVGGVVGNWSNSDQTLTLSHDTLIEFEWYQVEIRNGTDKEGYPLQPNPNPFDPNSTNPWQFMTAATYPYIVSTYPADSDVGVALDQVIIINFSEEMDTATVTWMITPNPGIWEQGWSNGNTTLTLYHNSSLFLDCKIYQVEVTAGKDLRGLPLVSGPAPNPWNFTTLCEFPYIVLTDPANNDTGIPFDYPITISFSEEMNKTTVTWTITPDPGGWSEVWSNGNTTLTLYHTNPFAECQGYRVQVTGGNDLDGNPLIPGPNPLPNPWSFKTACIPPYITQTDPYDGQTEVPIDYNITIWFSEPVNPGTFMFVSNPDPLGWGWNWLGGNTSVVLSHNNFDTCTLYTIEVLYVEDEAGLTLVSGPVPNPWSFSTVCPNPYLVSTDPYHRETGVSLDHVIVINFSKPMNKSTVVWTISPNPGGWQEGWSNMSKTLTLYHNATPFAESTTYTVQVVDGYDTEGYQLMDFPWSAPNPWVFSTGKIPNPMIVKTVPAHGEDNVRLDQEIIVNFSKAMDTPTVTWNVSGPGSSSFVWTPIWSNGSKTLTLYHNTTLFWETSIYTVEIHGSDTQGKPLVSNPNVQNPWSFRTGKHVSTPTGLTVTRDMLLGNVVLNWNPVVGADYYNVYESQNRFAQFPIGWTLYTNVTNTFFNLPQLLDGLTHYYIVRAYSIGLGEESDNSTMGVKFQKDFSHTALSGNIYWMSLPYNSEYKKASDIVNELDGNIDVVGKWDRSRQRTVVYFYARGKWRGTDFPINAGDGIYVGAASSFSWVITGTDREISIDLPFSPSPNKLNRHWISVPSTGNYTRASDIVMDIEGGFGVPGKIVEVGKWDPLSQSIIRYYYKGGWTGTDFAIEPGDGIYLKVITTFTWAPGLVTPYVG